MEIITLWFGLHDKVFSATDQAGKDHDEVCKLKSLAVMQLRKILVVWIYLIYSPIARINFGTVQDPQKVDLLDQKSGLLEPHPNKTPSKNPIFRTHFVWLKVDLLADLEWCAQELSWRPVRPSFWTHNCHYDLRWSEKWPFWTSLGQFGHFR